MTRRTAGLVLALALGAGVTGIAAASMSAASPTMRLPNADLVCGTTTLKSAQWVARPPSGTVWITSGRLAGHYVILSDAHYVMDGYQEEPPATYEGEPLATNTYGTKTAFSGRTLSCDFVSRWGAKGAPVTYSVVGPMVLGRLPA